LSARPAPPPRLLVVVRFEPLLFARPREALDLREPEPDREVPVPRVLEPDRELLEPREPDPPDLVAIRLLLVRSLLC
jgi:hypothetical protein